MSNMVSEAPNVEVFVFLASKGHGYDGDEQVGTRVAAGFWYGLRLLFDIQTFLPFLMHFITVAKLAIMICSLGLKI